MKILHIPSNIIFDIPKNTKETKNKPSLSILDFLSKSSVKIYHTREGLTADEFYSILRPVIDAYIPGHAQLTLTASHLPNEYVVL